MVQKCVMDGAAVKLSKPPAADLLNHLLINCLFTKFMIINVR